MTNHKWLAFCHSLRDFSTGTASLSLPRFEDVSRTGESVQGIIETLKIESAMAQEELEKVKEAYY